MGIFFIILFIGVSILPILFLMSLHKHMNALKRLNLQGNYPSMLFIYISLILIVLVVIAEQFDFTGGTILAFISGLFHCYFFIKYVISINQYHKDMPCLLKLASKAKVYLILSIMLTLATPLEHFIDESAIGILLLLIQVACIVWFISFWIMLVKANKEIAQ